MTSFESCSVSTGGMTSSGTGNTLRSSFTFAWNARRAWIRRCADARGFHELPDRGAVFHPHVLHRHVVSVVSAMRATSRKVADPWLS